MGLIDFIYITNIDLSTNSPSEKIKEIKKRILNYLRANDHLYGTIDYNAGSISFDNATVIRRFFPFYGLKTYEIKFKNHQESVEIEATCLPGGLLVMTVILIGALAFNIFFGLALLPIFGLFLIFNYLTGLREIKDILNICIRTDFQEKGEITKEQKEWIEDHSRCPACGQKLGQNRKNCPDCGLSLIY